MLLPASHEAAFRELTEMIARFWEVQDRTLERSEAVILVDLQHNDLNCLLGCLTGAKYLSQLTGAGLAGVVGQNATQRAGGRPEDYHEATVRQLAEAFGVSLFLSADPASLADFVGDRPEASAAIRADLARFDALWAPGAEPDWTAVATFRSGDGGDVGLGVADSVAKVLGEPRAGAVARDLTRALLLEALQVRAFGHWVCGTVEVLSYVTSHLCYASWASLATTVSEHGGRVVLADSLPNGTAFSIVAPGSPAAERIGDRRAQGLAALFDRLAALDGPAQDGLRAKTAVLLSSSSGPAAGWWRVDQAARVERDPASTLRARALAKLDVADVDAPVAFVLSHCQADAARLESGLFEDYYAWLVATLDVAREVTDRTWVVRFHPWYRMFREGPVVERIKAAYGGCRHIRFDDAVLTKDEYFSACDLAVTVRGTAAWELGRWAIPVIAAGRSWYERAGFVHAPATIADYEALLRRPVADLAAPADGPRAALSFAAYTMLLLPLSSPLCPPREEYPFGSLLTALAQRYRATVLELDPGFRAMARAWHDKDGAAVNEDLWQLLAGAAAGSDGPPGGGASPGERVLARELARWAASAASPGTVAAGEGFADAA